MEHVRDAKRAWTNMCGLLAPGGVAFAFHPTLYAPPFLINWLAPEALTAPVLRFFFADRHDADYPKVPARYELCTAEPGVVEPALRRAGFRQVLSSSRIDLVVFALPITAEQRILTMLRKLWNLPIDIRLAARVSRRSGKGRCE